MTDELAMYEGEEEQSSQNGQQQNEYNPADHMMQLGDKEYLTADHRIQWFRMEYPEGTIETKEVVVDLDRVCEKEVWEFNPQTRKKEKVLKQAKGYARFYCVAKTGKGGIGTGTKTETAVDFPDYVEKAEKGAVARALAALKYSTVNAQQQKAELRRPADSPVPPLHTNGTSSTTNGNGSSRPNSQQQQQQNGNSRPTRPPVTVEDAYRGLSLTEQDRVDICWQLLSPEERNEVTSFCGIPRPREKGWTLQEYRCFLSNMDKKKATKRMEKRIYELVDAFPQSSYIALRQRLGGNIAKSKVPGYTWGEVATVHTILVECQLLHDLGIVLDPEFKTLKTQKPFEVDHPLDLFSIEEGVEKRTLYLKTLQEKYETEGSKLSPEVKARHKATLDIWEKERSIASS